MEQSARLGPRTQYGIHDILAELAAASISNRDKGTKFERLLRAYFTYEPAYQAQFDQVWMWQEWPDRGNQPDTGIDLVARERDSGRIIAIQAKFFEPTHTLDKSDLDSFFTASGRHPFAGRIIVSTTDRWTRHAEQALVGQQIPVTRIRVQDLEQSTIDWRKFRLDAPEDMARRPKKQLRPHQRVALEDVNAGFAAHDRGKLIMACGTGKTLTALRIAEARAGVGKTVLFLVPSIALLGQTLREWTAEAEVPLRSFAVCSDGTVGRKRDDEDLRVQDLAFPATTDAIRLRAQLTPANDRMTVIFSTYQSIEVVIGAVQALGKPLDLVVCDEAHRTTGAKLETEDQSPFTLVHDGQQLPAAKRLYMTATPRMYSDTAQSKARAKSVVLWSMDDEAVYGPELHRLNFGEAVQRGLLTDYKVLILAVDEKHVSKSFQAQLSSEGELKLDDVVRIIGTWNGLAKRIREQVGDTVQVTDTKSMRRAVAFARTIKDSQRIAQLFTQVAQEYIEQEGLGDEVLHAEAQHVDGTFNILARNQRLDWLREPTPDGTCRILTNARCLAEGVDVPTLDAVMFLQPRKSEIDIVQAVGRVMRLAPDKELGYIILPIGIPAGVPAHEALADNEKYKVVWQVLQALRAHDERFDSMVNKIDLNKTPPSAIQVIGVGGGAREEPDGQVGTGRGTSEQMPLGLENIGEWRDALYARIVQRVGTAPYWENWAKDIATIAQRHIDRINLLIEQSDGEHRKAFDEFLASIRANLNPSVDQTAAVEMLAQHLITQPVFEALFEDYSFTAHNPVSQSMQAMLALLERQALDKETASLDRFYESVRMRVSDIDNAEGKQKIIVELYDKFFKTAFPRLSDALGIVYTPIEIVDFILHSVDHVLRAELGSGLADEGVHILDPFSGTGTFMVRLLQSGLIPPEKLAHKFLRELHTSEIVLLAYYIGAINVEQAIHALVPGPYQPFPGAVLQDTFASTEDFTKGQAVTIGKVVPVNSERAKRQLTQPIRVIASNPPYSAGQDSGNDNNQNLKYPKLDERIRSTYALHSTAQLKNSLYDSYIRAFRWASDRIGDKGVVCFVSNGGWLDGNAQDGMRKVLAEEFSSVHVYNLRGNARTSGEQRRKESGNVFGLGSRAQIAITLLVKDPQKTEPAAIHYHDIGDYLTREQKLDAIRSAKSVAGLEWTKITPNVRHDWLNQRGEEFAGFQAIGSKDAASEVAMFTLYSGGLKSNRDSWVYNFARKELSKNVEHMVETYNDHVRRYAAYVKGKVNPQLPKDWVEYDTTRISWSVNLLDGIKRGTERPNRPERHFAALYRPFVRQNLYFDRQFNDRVGHLERLFPTPEAKNLLIGVTGSGAGGEFATLMTNLVPDLHVLSTDQYFPLYIYEPQVPGVQGGLYGDGDDAALPGYSRRDAIGDATLAAYRQAYSDPAIEKVDIFYYVYGLLHSTEYRERFGADLRKELPRIPKARDFRGFEAAGRALADLHVHYESVPRYPLTIRNTHPQPESAAALRVEKMRYPKKSQRDTLIYNQYVTISGIPAKAHEYVLNGRSALDWLIERYQVVEDKGSGIVNDPNLYSENPAYILDLIQRVVHVCVETVRIVQSLPPLDLAQE